MIPTISRVSGRTTGTAPILASLGHINPYKRLEAVFRALHDLRESYPGLRYLLVGSV